MSDGYVAEKKSNGICIAALVCGIVSMFCCNPFYLVSIAAIILGIVGVSQDNDGKGMAIGGIVLGAIGIITNIIIDVLTMGVGLFF